MQQIIGSFVLLFVLNTVAVFALGQSCKGAGGKAP